MEWHKKCRLCLTDNPMRPVHVLQSPELRKLLKDLCQIEIQNYDNMDLVCTNCVQVVTTLKFFISNQRVIDECRGFQQIMLNIKEENESSDCAITDNKHDLDSNKNNQLKEDIAIDAHDAPVVSTINNSKLSTTKRKESRDDANLFDASILLASDEDNSFNDTLPKLKKCKIILTRTNPFETKKKNSIASTSSAATITENNILTTNTNSQTTQSAKTITTTKDCTGTRNNQVNHRKSITTTTIVSEAEVCSTYNIHSSKVPASTTRISSPTIITQKALDKSKSPGSGNNNKKPQAHVTLPNPTLMIRKVLDNSKTAECSRNFLLAHNKVNNNEKPKAGVTTPNSTIMIRKALDNSECTVNLLLPPNKVNNSEIPKANIKKQFTSTSNGFNQLTKDIQSNNCPNMKVLTIDELNNKSQSNPNSASELHVRIVRNGLNFGVRIQKHGCAVTVSHLSLSQLNHIRHFIKEASNANKNIQFLFSMGVPDEETKSLFRILQMDYAK